MAGLVDRPRQERTSRYYWEREHEPGEKFIPYFWQEFTSQVMIFFLFLGIVGGLALLGPPVSASGRTLWSRHPG